MEQKTKELNSIIVLLLILSIIRSIIRVFTAIVAMQIYSDVFVILEIVLSIFVIAASIGILFKNKYALIALFGIGACIVITAFCSGNHDTGFVQLFIMGLWALIFCLKKNGQSAWKTILFDGKKDSVNVTKEKTLINTENTDSSIETTSAKEIEIIQESSVAESNNNVTNQMENVGTITYEVKNEEEKERMSDDFNNPPKRSPKKRVSSIVVIALSVGILILIIGLLSYWAWDKFSKTKEEKFEEAKALFKGNRTEEAVQILEDLVDNDYVKAKTALGNIYLLQKSVPLNSQKGFSYLEDAAKSDTNAIHLLVVIYGGKKCKGETFQDDQELKKYADLAIKNNCCVGLAYFELGNIYARQENYPVAFYNWQKATEYNQRSAHRNIGILYYNGWGCDVNYEKAKYHFDKALEETPNDSKLLLYIGLMHKYGNGVSRNISLAKEYLKKSADKGNEYAQKEYAELEMSN